MNKLMSGLFAAVVVIGGAMADPLPCAVLTAQIAKKITSNNVTRFDLVTVPVARIRRGEVVGTCESGTKAILYERDRAIGTKLVGSYEIDLRTSGCIVRDKDEITAYSRYGFPFTHELHAGNVIQLSGNLCQRRATLLSSEILAVKLKFRGIAYDPLVSYKEMPFGIVGKVL